LVRQVKPVYPVNARNEGIEGTVHLQGIIASDGTLVGLHALNGADADLMNAALEAAKQWQYLPAALNGVPIEVVTQIDIEFKLVQ
jgi:TonB family protein